MTKTFILILSIFLYNNLLFSMDYDSRQILLGKKAPYFPIMKIQNERVISPLILEKETEKILLDLGYINLNTKKIKVSNPYYSNRGYRNTRYEYNVIVGKQIRLFFDAYTGELISFFDHSSKNRKIYSYKKIKKIGLSKLKEIKKYVNIKKYNHLKIISTSSGYDFKFYKTFKGFIYADDYILITIDSTGEFSSYYKKEHSLPPESLEINISEKEALNYAQKYIKIIPEKYYPQFLNLKWIKKGLVNPNYFAYGMKVHDTRLAYRLFFKNKKGYIHGSIDTLEIWVDTETGEILGGKRTSLRN
jgi:hypothetical protein